MSLVEQTPGGAEHERHGILGLNDVKLDGIVKIVLWGRTTQEIRQSTE